MKKTTMIGRLGKHYAKPTPKRWRQLGDALLGVALMGIPAQLSGHEWIAVTLFILGIAGKFLTNFFKETPTSEPVVEDEEIDNEPMEI